MANSEKHRPIGSLGDMLDQYEAPVAARRILARRVGHLAGTPYFPMGRVQQAIEGSMQANGGLPNWEEVQGNLANSVREVYKKMRR